MGPDQAVTVGPNEPVTVKQEQASLVAVWAERRDHPHTNMPGEVEVFRLRNASPLPLYNVQVFSHRYVDRETPVDDAVEDSRFDIGTLPPSEAPRVEIAHVSPTDSFVYALEFRDARGNMWHRDRRGQLIEGPLVGREKFQSRHPLTFDDF